MAKSTSSVVLSTSLSPVAHGVLGALALREDPAHAEANGVITRLLREELERLAPGLWDELIHRAKQDVDAAPRSLSEVTAADVLSHLRARAAK